MKSLQTLLTQLEKSQWDSAHTLQDLQLERFARLTSHAWRHSPFFRLRLEQAGFTLGQAWTAEAFARIPLLTRSELMLQEAHIRCHAIPPEHGQTYRMQTSGSTGQVVSLLRTDCTQLHWLALAMREHQWHRRDFSATLAIIKATTPTMDDPIRAAQTGWGPPVSLFQQTGPSFSQPLSMPVAQQAVWLARIDPKYLLTYPTNLSALLDAYERGEAAAPVALRQVRTVGETLHPGLRERCKALGDIGIVDMYSSQELGLIALQCPESGLYHTQDENLIVEILDEQGQPCAEGAVGRVVITDLHNYATPLIRYEIRDYAERGPACSCGRGLGSLKRIMGRRRNMVTLPDGSKHWPLVGAHRYREVADIRQYQVIQHGLDDIELRLLVTPLTPGQEAAIATLAHQALGHPFKLRFSYFDRELPNTGNGKFEEFISLLA
ncbi:MAG: phenylacetate--CoA ligase family protein [Gammaproteobacteria bacterium]|nr:phenylacetate--CoA ligase family protein [Gammaproteobacteria bacterium]MBU4045336.1 phenylacetate--CoA ligase family protein [Gammaproteobacteria bacterium]MBU4151207.1 phenylacetate--CoA ligase family protein [Gammaproteobacteria bacterium]